MISGKLLEKNLLQSPNERPFRGIVKNFCYALVISILAVIFISITNKIISRQTFIGILLISNGLSFFGWGSERLWYFTISKMLSDPFSKNAYLTRIPFWFIGGGIGVSLTSLLANKFGFIYILSVPQHHIFIWGGICECLIQIPLQMLVYRNLIKKFKS